MRAIPSFVHRNLTTIVVAAAVAAVTAGGPAVAGSVVDFAKNAGTVDGLSAVRAGAPAAAQKGRLVATNATTGTLPASVIGTAPDAARLGGVPVAGFAPSVVDARDYPMLGKTLTPVCRTPLLTLRQASVATVSADLTIGVSSTSNAVAITALEVSLDGGSTFRSIDGSWVNVVEVGGDIRDNTVTHTTAAALAAHTQVVFALGVVAETGTGLVSPDFAECSVSATVTGRTPGSVVRLGATPAPIMLPTGRRAPTFRQLLALSRSAGAARAR